MEKLLARFGYAIWMAFCLTMFFEVRIDDWRLWITIIGLAVCMAVKEISAKTEDKDEQ
jgi:ABC-type transport system involved in cytochrome bd biosynthesis fused ATPase/permease subunit